MMDGLWSTSHAALESMSFLVAVATVTASAEWLVPWRRTGPRSLIAPVAGDRRRICPETWSLTVRGLHLARITAGVCVVMCILAGGTSGAGTAMAVLAVCCVLLRIPVLRLRAGMDGAETLMTAVALAAALGRISNEELAMAVVLIFVALLVSLEYVGAGFWKLANFPKWASGENLTLVLRSRYYGCPRVRDVRDTGGKLSRVLLSSASVGAVILELMAPLALLLPPAAAWVIVLALLIFHLLNAVVMGLNTFVWAYSATYPAVLFTNGVFHHTVSV